MRDSVVFYKSFRDAIKRLPVEEQLKAYDAIMDYAFEGIEVEDGIAAAILLMAKPQIDANNQRYENGRKGGRPKTELEPSNNQTETKPKPNHNQTETKPKPNVNVNDNDNANDNVNDNANAAHEEAAARKQVLERWNKTSFKTVNKIPAGGTRAERLTARIKEYGVDEVIRAVDIAEKSKYLHDQEWFNFDWFIRPNNFPKVIDGNYTDSDKPPDKPLNPKVHFENERTYDFEAIEKKLLAKQRRVDSG